MPSKSRRRNLAQSRRRTADEGEDDISVIVDGIDDSQSDFSTSSVEASERQNGVSKHGLADGEIDGDTQAPNGISKASDEREARPKGIKSETVNGDLQEQETHFRSLPDATAMMNGLDIADTAADSESVTFDQTQPAAHDGNDGRDSGPHSKSAVDGGLPGVGTAVNPQDTVRTRRSARPPVGPARGGHFMHDSRGLTTGQNGSNYPLRQGRGGRGGMMNGAGIQSGPLHLQNTSKAKWDHDMHDAMLESDGVAGNSNSRPYHAPSQPLASAARPAANSLSVTANVGTVSVRVLLPAMEKPIVFERMPVRQHTRLPDLRPPLRRDKPVRIAIPDVRVRYIFPSVERSFIFIPRAQRPGMHSGRSRAPRSAFNQFGSRRSSVYGGAGGSMYTPSVARSRRSSQARDGLISPAGSVMSRPPYGAPADPSRPIVKLPVNGQQPYDMIGAQFHGHMMAPPMMPMPPPHLHYPPPAQQAIRETHASQIHIHQPRPQKQVSVASIESPSQGPLHAPQQQEQQPFHHQVPRHMSAQPSPYDTPTAGHSHSRQQSFSGRPSDGTLSNIPEQAVNAQPFQPTSLPPQPFFPPQPYPVYPFPGPVDQFNGPSQPPFYLYPQQPLMAPMMMVPQPAAGAPPGEDPQGMFAHESNGMVYYYPHVLPGSDNAPATAPAPAAFAEVPADAYYYPAPPQGMVYYPPQ